MGLHDLLTNKREEYQRPPHTPAMIRDYASILVCAMIVFASISLGFLQAAIKVFFNLDITFDASWNANLSSMASMALGALIQQKIGAPPGVGSIASGTTTVNVPGDIGPAPSVATSPPVTQPGVCPCCGQALPYPDPPANNYPDPPPMRRAPE